MPNIQFEDSFESLTHEEWEEYLSVDYFDDFFIDKVSFGISANILQNIEYPRLEEMIYAFNNKVCATRFTYAIARHYFDKGIPDEPWFKSPGDKGQSIQYMPNFKPEHWMRQMWFNYFSDIYYVKLSSLWDAIIEIINHYKGYDFPEDNRLRSEVIKRLKTEDLDLCNKFLLIKENEIYKTAQKYRNDATHGVSAGDVKNTVKVRKEESCLVISGGVGEYVCAREIMKNMVEYAKYSGKQIQEIVQILLHKEGA